MRILQPCLLFVWNGGCQVVWYQNQIPTETLTSHRIKFNWQQKKKKVRTVWKLCCSVFLARAKKIPTKNDFMILNWWNSVIWGRFLWQFAMDKCVCNALKGMDNVQLRGNTHFGAARRIQFCTKCRTQEFVKLRPSPTLSRWRDTDTDCYHIGKQQDDSQCSI